MDKVVEIRMSDYVQQVTDLVVKEFDESISSQLDGLDKVFSKLLFDTVSAAIGLEYKFGHYEVASKGGVVQEMVRVRVKKVLSEFQQEIDDEIRRQVGMIDITKLVAGVIKTTIDYDLKSDIRDHLKRAVSDSTKTISRQLTSVLRDRINELVSGDMMIPTSYSGKLGQKVLGHMIDGDINIPEVGT